jgi:hypothetical protein
MVLYHGEKFSSPPPTAQHQQNAGVTHPPIAQAIQIRGYKADDSSPGGVRSLVCGGWWWKNSRVYKNSVCSDDCLRFRQAGVLAGATTALRVRATHGKLQDSQNREGLGTPRDVRQ